MLCYCIIFILWILAVCTGAIITCFSFEAKDGSVKKIRLILELIAIQIPINLIKYVFNHIMVINILGIIMISLGFLVFMVVRLRGYLWQKTIFTIFHSICYFFAEMVVQVVLNEELVKLGTISFTVPIMVVYSAYVYVLATLMFLAFSLFWKYFVTKRSYDMKIFLLFSIFPTSQIIMMSAINDKVYDKITPSNTITIVGILVSAVADVFLLFALLKQQDMQEMSIRLSEMQKAWDIEQNHYNDIEARREELAKIRHDMTEQFVVIKELLHQENYDKANDMLDTLIQYVASTKEYAYCGDPVVNAIMAENEKLCQEKGIALHYDLAILQPLNMNPVVICSIFSNLMRNAIAAAGEAVVPSEAFVSVKAALKGDYLHIKVDNTYCSQTKKKARARKAYGQDILKTLADKYHGQFNVIAENDIYSVRISVENVNDNVKSLSF